MRGREAEVGRCASPARLRTYALPATLSELGIFCIPYVFNIIL